MTVFLRGGSGTCERRSGCRIQRPALSVTLAPNFYTLAIVWCYPVELPQIAIGEDLVVVVPILSFQFS
jgi:hypothetical protein